MKFILVLPLTVLCIACSPAKEQPKLDLSQGANVQTQHKSEASVNTLAVDATQADTIQANTMQYETDTQTQPANEDAENLVEINTHTAGGLRVNQELKGTLASEQTATHHQPNHLPSSKKVYSEDLGAVLIGDYVGNLPCKSCQFIQVLLQLDVDGTAKKTTSYIIDGKPLATKHHSVVEAGYYTQKGEVINIHFLSENRQESYQIEGSNLILLTDNQSEAMDITASDYVLAKR